MLTARLLIRRREWQTHRERSRYKEQRCNFGMWFEDEVRWRAFGVTGESNGEANISGSSGNGHGVEISGGSCGKKAAGGLRDFSGFTRTGRQKPKAAAD